MKEAMAWNSICSARGEECACFSLCKVTSVLHGGGSQTAFCLPALFVAGFFSVNAFVPWRDLILSFVLFSLQHLKGINRKLLWFIECN